jgi:YidC/Oxa1 family membrane protein insertase
MEKRVFLAIFLCFVVLAVYQAWFAPPPLPAPVAQPAPQTQAAAPTAGAPAAPVPGAATPDAAQKSATPAPAPVLADTEAHDIVVETEDVHAVFTTQGAVLKSWQLKRYPIDKVPFELVPQDIPAGLPRPFTLATDDLDLSTRLASALFKPSASGLTLGSEQGVLTFEYKDASGLAARKTFHFRPDGKAYNLGVEASIDVAGAVKPVRLDWGPALGLGWKPDGSREVPAGVVIFRTEKIERIAASNLAAQPHQEGPIRYAGVEEQYFLSVVMPGTEAIQLDFVPITLPVPESYKQPGKTRNFVGYSVKPPAGAGVQFFLGPKDLTVLRSVDPQLVRAIDFGIFSWLVVPLLQALKSINSVVGNYGWSIVVLTILINIAIFPLRHKSMVSMKKMQALQPEIKSIQERYAKYKVTDPERQKMNQEMMALYKQKGVSPASGCVPMLLTLPILYAFYNLLYSSIELRGAPFMFWIHDLSLRDPKYITPILMGATMFIQQKMMPSTADPMQQKMFLILPVIFTVSFLWAPSGLVIYWLLSNVLAIGQQYVTNRIIKAPTRSVPALAKPVKSK